MTHTEFINAVIDKGIAAARRDYSHPSHSLKLSGAVAGFNACRDLSVDDLRLMWETAEIASRDARERGANDYWWYRCYAAEVYWICNCVSAVLHNQGLPTIVPPTARGLLCAAEIVGVRR